MKKITLSLAAIVGLFGSVLSQVNINVAVPPPINSSTQVRLPNGMPEHKSLKGVMLLKASDLTALTATLVNQVGFILQDGTDPALSIGNFSLWVLNTADVTNNKSGLGFNGAIAGMTLATSLNNNFTVGTSAVQSTVPVNGLTAFSYTGAGLYLAWHWEENTPAVNTNTYYATWAANLGPTGNQLCASSSASTALGAPDALAGTDFRPIVVFTASNTATNETSVEFVYSPGKVEKMSGAPVPIAAIIKNGSIGALSTVSVGMTVSGANTAVGSTVIPSISAGGTVAVAFSYVPTSLGSDVITVGLLPDQNPANNTGTQTQSVTCNEVAIHPVLTAGSYTSQGYGAGASAAGLIYSFRYNAGVTCSATAVRLVVPGFSSAANLGKQIFAVCMDNTGAIIGQGNVQTITTGMLDQFSAVTFTSPVQLASGQDYNLGIGIVTNAYFPIGNTAFNGPVIAGYFSSPITGGAFTPLTVGHLSLEGVLAFPGSVLTASATTTVVCKASPIQVTLTASGAQSYTWSVPGLGNGGTAVYTPTASGSLAQLSVVGSYTTGSASGCKSNSSALTFSLAACTGIAENTGANAVKVYPNPAVAGKTSISNLNGLSTISVFNTLGQVIITRTTSNETENIDLSSYPSGNYMVRITDSNNESRIVKLINQN